MYLNIQIEQFYIQVDNILRKKMTDLKNVKKRIGELEEIQEAKESKQPVDKIQLGLFGQTKKTHLDPEIFKKYNGDYPN